MAVQSDPAFAAYMRALGFDKDIAREDAAMQQTQARASAQLAKPELMAQGVERREGINDSFEDRGMFLGSERLRGLASQRRGEQYQLALIDKTQADQLADIDMALRRELAGIGRTEINAQAQHDAWLASGGGQTAVAMDPMSLVELGRSTQQAGLRRPVASTSRFG